MDPPPSSSSSSCRYSNSKEEETTQHNINSHSPIRPIDRQQEQGEVVVPGTFTPTIQPFSQWELLPIKFTISSLNFFTTLNWKVTFSRGIFRNVLSEMKTLHRLGGRFRGKHCFSVGLGQPHSLRVDKRYDYLMAVLTAGIQHFVTLIAAPLNLHCKFDSLAS